jgi:hypothetical protein
MKKSPLPWREAISGLTLMTISGRSPKNFSGSWFRQGAPSWKWHGADMCVPVCVPSDWICSRV